MIVFKNDTETIFNISYKSEFIAQDNLNDVKLTFVRINGDDTEYAFDANIEEYDCFNRMIKISSTVSLDTGEYKVYLYTIGLVYSLEYSSEYSRDKALYTIAVDNANIKRENDITTDTRNVAYIE